MEHTFIGIMHVIHIKLEIGKHICYYGILRKILNEIVHTHSLEFHAIRPSICPEYYLTNLQMNLIIRKKRMDGTDVHVLVRARMGIAGMTKIHYLCSALTI